MTSVFKSGAGASRLGLCHPAPGGQLALLLAVPVLLLVLAGCPKMVGMSPGVVSVDSGQRAPGGQDGPIVLTLVADNWWQVAPAFGGSGGSSTDSRWRAAQRTIVADSYTTATPLHFYATATSSTGATFPLTKVNFTAAANNRTGSVQVPLGLGSWDVDVYACLTDNLATLTAVQGDAVLKGSAHADTMNSSAVFFTLSPKGLTKSGAVSLTLNPATALQALTGLTATASVRNIDTGQTVLDTGNATTEKQVAGFPAGTGTYTANLSPGTYLFQLALAPQQGGTVPHVWSDIIIVLPGRGVTSTLEIPNFVGTIPAAPTGLTAAIVTGSENAGTGDYLVKLDWTDASDNESHFQLELAELADSTPTPAAYPANDTDWGNLTANATTTAYGTDFFGSGIRETGSLNAGNTSATLRLKLGSRYVARLRSVGGAGASAWVYPTLPAGGTGTTAITSTTISRFAVTYDLAGGTYTPQTGAATTARQVHYHSQNSNPGVPILAPTAANGQNSLVRDNGQWGSWLDTGTGAAYPATGATPNAYTDFKNLSLRAQYVVQPVDLSFAAITHSTVELQLGWITVGGRSITNSMVSFSKGTGGLTNLDFAVAVPNNTYPFNQAGFAYESISLELKNNRGVTVFVASSAAPVTAGTRQTFTMPNLAQRTSGNYICTVRAHYTPSIVVSQQFILQITN